MDERNARLRTEAGWRKAVGRWRLLAAVAVVELLVVVMYAFLDLSVGAIGLAIAAAGLSFQAGMLKAEDDRLKGRGMYRFKPPWL